MTDTQWIYGAGLATCASDGSILDVWFAQLGYKQLDTGQLPEPRTDPRRHVTQKHVAVRIDPHQPPASVEDAYLRLHALSWRLVKPNTINLDGIFAQLPLVAWTNVGPVSPKEITENRAELQHAGIQVYGLDKFPRMLDYVVPLGVRIANAAQVRLGAYLSPGTTVMHAGFVNFNAGTLGSSMVEGRISQGVVVGDGSDIGGGASIMGTLSGGGTHRISVGERTLVGANAGIGISLGNDCIVEAGLYLTAGAKVVLANEARNADGNHPTIKAERLSGSDGILFRRNSLSGAIEAVRREGVGVTLNAALHA